MRKKTKKMILPAVLISLLSSFNPVMAEEAKTAVIDEVVVRSTALSDYLVTTEVITAKKIKEMGATNLAEAIARVPGLYVTYGGKASQLVRIRGAASDQTKIYIDGMPVFPLSGLNSNSASSLAQILTDNIEKIEIIKGPGPVQYGTDYKGGIILITTKNGQGPGHVNLDLSAGSHNSYNDYISYSGSDNNTSYYFTGGKNHSDGYLRNSKEDENNVYGKIKWNLNKNSDLTLSGYNMDADRQIANDIDQRTGLETTSTTNWSGDKGVKVGSVTTYSTKDWHYTGFKQSNIALQFDQKTNDKFKYNVKWYHVTDGNDLWVYNQTNANLGLNTYANPLWYRSGWYSQGNGIAFTGDLQTARNNTVTFGTNIIQINWYKNENNSDLDQHGNDQRFDYYIQDNWKVNDKTNVVMGARYDQAKQSYYNYKNSAVTMNNNSTIDATDPVFNMTHQLGDKDTLRFSAGKTHVFVQASQASTNILAGAPIPNPEKSNNYEVGWKHNFDEKASLDFAAFQTKIDNRIDKRTSDKLFYNIARTEIKGVELQYNRNFTKRLQGFVNYTYQDAHDFSQTGVDTLSVNLPQGMFNYGLTYTVDKFQTSVLGHALGKVQTDSTTYPQLASYHLVDLNFNYQASGNTNYYLRVNNIFNVNYWDRATYPGEGINCTAGVTIKL